MSREDTMRAVLGLKPGQEARVYDGTQPVIEVRGDRREWPDQSEWGEAARDAEAEWEANQAPVIDDGFDAEWEAPEPECECVPTDVDMVDNSSCQVHGVRW